MCGSVQGVAWADVEDDLPFESELDWMQSGVLHCVPHRERRRGFLSRKGHDKLVHTRGLVALSVEDAERGVAEFSWRNKCLQLAVVRVLPNKERVRARKYFQRFCANSLGSGLVASVAERCNFTAVQRLLQNRGIFVWVYERDGVYAGCSWRLGTASGTCSGALHWDSGKAHVSVGVSGGGFVKRSFVQSGLPPPWVRSCVGASNGNSASSSAPNCRDILVFVPSSSPGLGAFDGAFLVDSFHYMKTSGGKKRNFFPELLAEIEAEFGVRMAAVCSAGAGFEAGSGSAATFAELLHCVPRTCRFIVPIICGNDWYDGFVRPLRASALDAARSFCEKLVEREVCSLSVLGMSSAVWGYDKWMAPLSARRFDEHAAAMAELFGSFGLGSCTGAAELAGLKLADRIGHVHWDGKAVVFGAIKAWVSECMLLLARPPAPVVADGRGLGVGSAPEPPSVPHWWQAVWYSDSNKFYF